LLIRVSDWFFFDTLKTSIKSISMTTSSTVLATQLQSSDREEAMISCFYANESPNLEILRIDTIAGWYFEKVVFPQQRLVFEAPAESVLDIYTCEFGSAVLADRLSCERLKMTVMS